MESRPFLQLWQHSTLTCYITPTTASAPYSVVICDGHAPVSAQTFKEHHSALTHALAELGLLRECDPSHAPSASPALSTRRVRPRTSISRTTSSSSTTTVSC